jgi:hypothetical protein
MTSQCFAEMLIHFRSGKLLEHSLGRFLAKVMLDFSVAFVISNSLLSFVIF